MLLTCGPRALQMSPNPKPNAYYCVRDKGSRFLVSSSSQSARSPMTRERSPAEGTQNTWAAQPVESAEQSNSDKFRLLGRNARRPLKDRNPVLRSAWAHPTKNSLSSLPSHHRTTNFATNRGCHFCDTGQKVDNFG